MVTKLGRTIACLTIALVQISTALAGNQDENRSQVSWTPESPEQGDALAVFVHPEGEVASITGRFIDKDLIFFPWGERNWMAFAPIPVGARTGDRPLSIDVVFKDGSNTRMEPKVRVRAHQFGVTQLRVDPRFIKPPEEERARIRRERQLIQQTFAKSADERLWRYPFVRSAEGRPTSRFGTRRTFNGEIRSRHWGLDIDGRTGDPVYALTDGRVVLAHDLFYAGRSVFLDHGNEFFTVYFHLSDIEVEDGDVVQAGQRIGAIGATGRVTGPHLHLGVRIQGRYVNPESFLKLELDEEHIASTNRR